MSTQTEELKQHRININGSQFTVSSIYGDDHIKEVENFVNGLFTELKDKCDTYSPTSLAILVALNLADELLVVRKKQPVIGDWEKNIISMCKQLDKVLVTS